ncbi:D-alanine--D-alanine ligase [Desulforamulus reducens MI-1]|uniref:D-alanine--D-alanine ligase n=1 Tax=Desulforamulus reducens (strain ATCC BAA-1160 / DSM 100696 / MI-1) TaxID=349161 RepID=DDL_DESRM|nr:D-alanine--D-alanine ligase [Desulforamulus reducens]A4J5G8.1 RecName: Full=D-alanine--D-alanine ligase; AltName: Full=D-Ala-D-Ala ligase; AltName: Full=D-alanylalanine synthetase [Desulforamulus reducens MI-1]ABO50321.1 D-alanine--D-alanine ligase [Desulforamulus reducens MI-1]
MALRIGVLCGGRSAEREVSLRSGEAVYQALMAAGYNDVVKIDVGYDLVEQLKGNEIQVAFLALHGKYGEDGTIQGLLEMLDIPYTGSGVLASALAINKIATKKIFKMEGIPTPAFSVITKKEVEDKSLQEAALRAIKEVGVPAVVKANTQGSTIGITFVHVKEKMAEAIESALKYDQDVLVEQFVAGTEVTASVLGNNSPEALPLIEITSVTGVYDYQSKYTPGMSDHIIPPRLPQDIQEKIKELAIKSFLSLGCRGLGRIDFIIRDNQPYALEVNTLPGMTATSLFPDAANYAGISFPELTDRLIKLALEQ